MPRSCSAPYEDSFGPVVEHCRSDFDFTLLFEETILFIGPLCLALLLAAFRFRQLLVRTPIVRHGWLCSVKITAYTAIVVTQAVLLAVTTGLDAPRTHATVPAVSLGLVGYLCLMALSYLEHCRSPRSSSLLSVYFLYQMPVDAVRARTMWNIPHNLPATVVFVVYSSFVGIACACELLSKRRLLIGSTLRWTSEQTCGIVERAFMTWMAPLFIRGYKARLVQDDLTSVDRHLLTDRLEQTVEGDSLLWSIFKTHSSNFLQPILPRILFGALTFAQAFLVRSATSYVGSPEDKHSTNAGNGLIVAYILVYLGIAVTNSLYLQSVARVTTAVRAGLVSQIYQRSFKLEIGASSHGATTTLMSTDVDRVQQGFRRMHDVWANFVTAGIALWLIYTQLGVAMAVSLALTIGTLGSKYQKTWLLAIEERISMFAQVLNSIKAIKMTGCGDAVRKMIVASRAREIKVSQRYRGSLIFSFVLSYCTLPLSPAFGICVHVALAKSRAGALLTSSEAYTALTLYTIVSASLVQGLVAAFQFQTAVGCLQRIQRFLSQHARVDYRRTAETHAAADSTPDSTTNEEKGEHVSGVAAGEDTPSDIAIQLRNFRAKWNDQSDWVLRDISLRVTRGGLTIIAGPTGCGKSTLLKAMLGEVRHVSGWVCAEEVRIGYCDQTPWLPNSSIKEVIVGPNRMDESDYGAVLRTCALDQDLSELPSGDESVCGSGGISLSGGQKQRITLARALFATCPLLVLDDCFSGLDARTEQHILKELFGPAGRLKQNRRTTILATSSARHLKWADNIVLLDRRGSILRQHSCEELEQADEELRALQLDHTLSHVSAEVTADQSHKNATFGQELESQAKRLAASAGEATGSLGLYKRTCEAAGGWLNVVIFLMLVIWFVVGTVYPQIYLRSWSQRSPHDQRESVQWLLGVYLGSSLAAWSACNFACVFFIDRILPAISAAFHTQLLDATLGAELSFFTTTDSGEIINRFSQDLSIIDRDIPFGILGFVVTMIQMVAQIVVVIVGSNFSGLAVPALLACLFVIQQAYLRTSKRLRLLDLEAKAPLFTQFLESLSGLATLRAFDWTRYYIRRGITAMEHSQPPFYLLWSAQNTLILVLNLLNGTLAIVVISIACTTYTSDSGSLGLALFSIVGLGATMRELILNWTNLEIALGAVARVCDFTTDTPSENSNGGREPPKDWPQKGTIDFRNVEVAYSPSLPPIISNQSLHIAPGSKIGICGRTGSGKSTLLGSLLRLVDLRAGSIVVDGQDIAELDKNAARSRFTVCPQEPLILPGTLRENANIRTPHHDECIVAAMHRFGLWEVFEAKAGLDTIMRDDILSHGQRQTFAFALSTLNKSSVLLLDEPTSQIDADLQEQIHQAIVNDFKHCTVLCITHRLDLILDFDAVIVMDQGKILEFDSPKALLERRGGSMFAQLYEQDHNCLHEQANSYPQ